MMNTLEVLISLFLLYVDFVMIELKNIILHFLCICSSIFIGRKIFLVLFYADWFGEISVFLNYCWNEADYKCERNTNSRFFQTPETNCDYCYYREFRFDDDNQRSL